jgi:hypothetical protein
MCATLPATGYSVSRSWRCPQLQCDCCCCCCCCSSCYTMAGKPAHAGCCVCAVIQVSLPLLPVLLLLLLLPAVLLRHPRRFCDSAITAGAVWLARCRLSQPACMLLSAQRVCRQCAAPPSPARASSTACECLLAAPSLQVQFEP